MSYPTILAIVGPTATGKTGAGVALCHALGGEVVSMDSMQVYQGMDIGTAKPTQAEMGGIPHHLMGVIHPNTPFSVAQYRQLADEVIGDILARGKVPVLVGGTGLYLNALTYEMDFAQAAIDQDFRAALEAQAMEAGGKAHLHQQLALVDPVSAARLPIADTRRVIRALEIHHLTGKPMSDHAAAFKQTQRNYAPLALGLTLPREKLYARIDARVHAMLAQGLMDEVKALVAQGIDPRCQAMQAIGYLELTQALAGKMPLPDAIARMQQRSRQYAKRQLTWFNRDPRVNWLDVSTYEHPHDLHEAMTHWVKERGL